MDGYICCNSQIHKHWDGLDHYWAFPKKKKIQPPVKDINGKFQGIHQKFKKKRGLPGGLIQKNVEFQRTAKMAGNPGDPTK